VHWPFALLKFWQSSLTFWQTPALLKNVRSEQFKQTEWSADQTAHKGSSFVTFAAITAVDVKAMTITIKTPLIGV
jgi:hypothetical protein